MSKNKYKALIIIIGSIFLSVVIYLQRIPIYLDLSNAHSTMASDELKSYFSDASSDIQITLFASHDLVDELDLSLLERWLTSLTPKISVSIFDPIKFPDKSDHYDIDSDGVIVIEHQSSRFDIDIIEQIIINEGHHIEYLQNVILRRLFSITQTDIPNALFIHSNHDSLLEDPGHIGLLTFKEIFNKNFISIDELSTQSSDQISKQYDLIILYKLAGISSAERNQISHFLSLDIPTIIFNHPKLSENMNSFLNTNASFHSAIIEDSNSHLIQSNNQLIVDYLSSLENQLIGVLPYSSYISVPTFNATTLIGTSSSTSYIEDLDQINGPFTIIYHDEQTKTLMLNNYLIPTNYWINFGDNQLIIEDIIFSMLDIFSYISTRDTHDDFIIFSYFNLLKLFLTLIILPPLAYILFRFYIIHASDY